MPVISVNIGERRVHLTAYCPMDALGLLACDFVLAIAQQVCDNTTPAQLRLWIESNVPDGKKLYQMIEAGWTLPPGDPFSVDPKNAVPELRIITHLKRELAAQNAGKQ